MFRVDLCIQNYCVIKFFAYKEKVVFFREILEGGEGLDGDYFVDSQEVFDKREKSPVRHFLSVKLLFRSAFA